MQMHLTEIFTNRFVLRPLNVGDVTDRYIGWLKDQAAQQYINAAVLQPDITWLRQYVLERSGRDDVVFLGIFKKENRLHIGNIKYEPVNSELGYAIMGLFIGETDWRGRGVATEVILASAEWLRLHRNIKQILLGVNRTNTAAILAYQKVGFVAEPTKFAQVLPPEYMTMVWHLS